MYVFADPSGNSATSCCPGAFCKLPAFFGLRGVVPGRAPTARKASHCLGTLKLSGKTTPKSAQTCLLPLKTCSPRSWCVQLWCIPSTQTHCCGTFSPRRTWSLKYVVDFASCSCLRTVLGHHIQPLSSHLTKRTRLEIPKDGGKKIERFSMPFVITLVC